MLINSVSLSGSFSQSGYSLFWPVFRLSVLQLPTMLRWRGFLVAAMATRVWGSCLLALTGKWVRIRISTWIALLSSAIVYFCLCEPSDYPAQSTGMPFFLTFREPEVSRTVLSSSRISWATIFACGIALHWFETLHWPPSRVVLVAVYYNNIWKAQNFPFVSPQSGLATEHRSQLTYSFLNSCFTKMGQSTIKHSFSTPITKLIPRFLLNKAYLTMPALGLSTCWAVIW